MKNQMLSVLGVLALLSASSAFAGNVTKLKTGHVRSLASEEISQADESFSVLGMLEAKNFTVNDKKVGGMVVYQVDNGSAANPVNVFLTIPAPEEEQQGDNEVNNVYHIGRGNNGVKSVKISGNQILITVSTTDVANDNKQRTDVFKVTYKDASGKVLKTPILN
jgi:hypothetical protein